MSVSAPKMPLTAPCSPCRCFLHTLLHPASHTPALKGQAQAPAPAAAPGRPQPAQGCNPWDIPALPSLSAAVDGHKQEADKQSRKRKATVEQVTRAWSCGVSWPMQLCSCSLNPSVGAAPSSPQGLELRRELADMSKVYDWGGMPFDDARQKNKDMVGGGYRSTGVCCAAHRKLRCPRVPPRETF